MEVWVLRGVAALYRQRWLIIALTVFTTIMGAVRGAFSETYEAQSLLLLTPFSVASKESELVVSTHPAKVYTSLLLSPQVAGKTLEKLVAKGVIDEDDQPRISDFIATLSVNVETVDATTRPVTYSPLISLRAEADTREQAIAVAGAWTEVAIERVNEMMVLPFVAATEAFNAQAKLSEEELQSIWSELSKEKSQFDVELMRADAQLKLTHLDLLQTELLTAKSNLEGMQKSLTALREVLAVEKPFLELAKAPSDEAFWLTETESGTDKAVGMLSGKSMVTQEINVAYWNLKEKEGETLSEISANEGKVASLTASIEQGRAEYNALQAALGEHSIKQRDLETREAVAKAVYEDVSKTAALNDVTLGMIHPEGEGLRPVGLNPLVDEIRSTRVPTLLGGRRAALTGGLLGFMLICCIILVRDVALPSLRQAVSRSDAQV